MKGKADLSLCGALVFWCVVREAGKKGLGCTSSWDGGMAEQSGLAC